MSKVPLALLGLLLLAILSFFCFQDKAGTIKENLVTSTNNALNANNIVGAKADLKGENMEMTDIIKLTGEVPSLQMSASAESIARSIAGVGGVDNQLTIAKQVPEVSETANAPQEISPVVATQDINESNQTASYILTVIKDDKNKIVLDGYVANETHQKELEALAEKLYGADNVTSHLKVTAGAPEDWEHISGFALEQLKEVDYGDMNLTDKSYKFTAHLPSPSTKENFLNNIRTIMSNPENKYARYRGDFIITAPVEESVVASKEAPKQTEIKTEAPKVADAKPPVDANGTVANCQSVIDALLQNNNVLFDYNKASVSKASYALLDSVAKEMQVCHVMELEIAGHTDGDGDESYNQKLSDLRAGNVKKYLITQGVDENVLLAKGYGETKPIASNTTREGRAKNRRIEFIVKGVK